MNGVIPLKISKIRSNLHRTLLLELKLVVRIMIILLNSLFSYTVMYEYSMHVWIYLQLNINHDT